MKFWKGRGRINPFLCLVSAGNSNLDLRVEVHPPSSNVTKTHPHVGDVTSMFLRVNVVRWCPTCLRRVWSTAPSAMRSTSTSSPQSTFWYLWWVTWTSVNRFCYDWMVQTWKLLQWGLSQMKDILFLTLLWNKQIFLRLPVVMIYGIHLCKDTEHMNTWLLIHD